jgi:hypothetical protein
VCGGVGGVLLAQVRMAVSAAGGVRHRNCPPQLPWAYLQEQQTVEAVACAAAMAAQAAAKAVGAKSAPHVHAHSL